MTHPFAVNLTDDFSDGEFLGGVCPVELEPGLDEPDRVGECRGRGSGRYRRGHVHERGIPHRVRQLSVDGGLGRVVRPEVDGPAKQQINIIDVT